MVTCCLKKDEMDWKINRLLIFVFAIHLPGALAGGDSGQMSMMSLLKDLAIAGGALVYASTQPIE